MSEVKIKRALLEGFNAGTFFSQLNTQYENIVFTPPGNAPWCALWFLPNQRKIAALGPTGTDEVTGIFQIDLNYPVNTGDKAAGDKAEAITAVFKSGSRFSYSGVEVIIRSCGRSPGKIVGSFFRVIVTISFYAHVNR